MKQQRLISVPEDTVKVILKVIQQANEPLSPEKIQQQLPGPFRVDDAKLLNKVLNEQVRVGAIYEWLPKKRKKRFWTQYPEEYASKMILEILSDKKLTLSELDDALRKSLFECSQSKAGELRKKILKRFLDDKKLFEHPKAGNEKKSRYGSDPLNPARYIKKVEKAFKEVCDRLRKFDISREQIFQAVSKELMPQFEKLSSEAEDHSSGIDHHFDHPAGLDSAIQAGRDGRNDDQCHSSDVENYQWQELYKMILDKIVEIEPAARRQALVSVSSLRTALNLPKQVFDQAVLNLASQEKIFLHRHVHAGQMSQEERSQMVTDGQGSYYMGVVLRN